MRRAGVFLVFALAVLLALAGLAKYFLTPGPSGDMDSDPAAWMEIPDAAPLSPEQEQATFTIADGYRIELVAAEPLVEDPVAIRFDERGRMWVVEMRGFMPNADGVGEDAPVGRVAILEDTDGDGAMDKRSEFLGDLALPRAVLPLGEGEALVLVPPNVVYAKDTDGDLIADEREVLDLRFPSGIEDPEYAANSPTLGLDNWIYFANFNRRLIHREGSWRDGPVAFAGQWGLSMDDQGRWFFNSNDDYLRAHLAPPHYESRHPHLDRPEFVNQSVAENQELWPIRVSPGVNRGYRPGVLRSNGTLKAFTAAGAPCVYRGGLMPDLMGNVFVTEPAAQLVRRAVVSERGTSLLGVNAYSGREFLASSDERFRPVDLQGGPDGALYVVDMYRGLIQHRKKLTNYLRRDAERRGLLEPIHLGRIWRIVPEDGDKTRRAFVLPAAAPSLVALLRHENGWVRDTAQRMLVRDRQRARGDLPGLVALARDDGEVASRLHALWTLEGIDELDDVTVLEALRSTDAPVREHAARLVEARVSKPESAILVEELESMAALEANGRVALQLAFSLGAIDADDQSSSDRATSALVELVTRFGDDPRIRDAVISGRAGVEVGFLQTLATDPRWQISTEPARDSLARLASCVVVARDEPSLHQLLEMAATESSPWRRDAIFAGIETALPPEGTRRIRLARRPQALDQLAADGSRVVKRFLARMDEALEIGDATAGRKSSFTDHPLFDKGAALYTSHCAPCHQPNGRGLDGLAPPLAGSEWVLGAPETFVRILLDGVGGPINVAGRRYDFPLMPGQDHLTDEDIAALGTYTRAAWQNEVGPIEASLVATLRIAERERTTAWTVDELISAQ